MSHDARRPFDTAVPAVFLVSMSVILLELALTRLFSATMHYHYAFMAISLALFGSGASGVAIYLARERLAGASGGPLGLASRTASAGALAAIAALLVALYLPPGQGGGADVARFTLLYAACAAPFFLLGSAITLAIVARAAVIGRLYLFDLGGAAAGCLLLVPLLDAGGGVNTILCVPIVASAGALLFALAPRQAPAGGAGLPLLIGLACVSLFVGNTMSGLIDVRQAKGAAEKDILFARWNSFSRVTVARTGGQALEIRIDADAATAITPGAGDRGRHPERRDSLTALPFLVKEKPDVLVMGPGGGDEVLLARLFGARAVTAVEVNPIIALDIMSSEPFRSFAGGIYQQPEVRLVVDDARSFIRRSPERHDIILATMVDTWAATAAGAFALAENHLYTVEAFRDYGRRLTDDGILSFTRWYFEPPDQMLRMVSLARAMMQREGIAQPERHLVVVRDRLLADPRTPACLLFKKSPFTDAEIGTLETFARMRDYALLYTPLTRPENDFTRLITAPDPAAVWRSYPTNIAPPGDDSPFFFNTMRPSDLLRPVERAAEWRKTNQGTVVLIVLGGIAALMVALFIVGPLMVAKRHDLAGTGGNGLRFLLYFAGLGAGFILIEVALVQRFILLLGPPVYALTVVLFSVLAFGAAGSGLTARIPESRVGAVLGAVLLAVAAGAALYALALPAVIDLLVPLARPARIAAAAALAAPLALLMGMPLPAGLRLLRREAPAIIPWAWGLNGAASVLGSIMALLIALMSGFSVALASGAALYLGAWAALRRIRLSSGPAPG
jgi:hypothetical protein